MNKKGFTIIEMLVAVMIIGILTVAITLGIMGKQRQARDSKRLEDINTITKGIEFYQIDNNKLPGDADDNGIQLSSFCTASGMMADLVTVGKYLKEMPSDPLAFNECDPNDLQGIVAGIDDVFFYAWDSHRETGKCECIGINRFESQWLYNQLAGTYPHDDGNLLDTEIGGHANIGSSNPEFSFNYCYVEESLCN